MIYTRIIHWILNHFDSILKLRKIKQGIKNYARIIQLLDTNVFAIREAIILLFNSYQYDVFLDCLFDIEKSMFSRTIFNLI